MNIKMYSVKNALIVAIFSSVFVFSSVAGAAKDGVKGKPAKSNGQKVVSIPPQAQRPDVPPGRDFNPPNRPANPGSRDAYARP